jgi:membrane protein implicated in regulation of membrane protease activity
MCHLFLALPLLALPVFWLWPMSIAAPLYASAVAVALLTYAYAWKAWRMPRLNGLEAVLGMRGKVVAVGARNITVMLGGELWSARTADECLAIGDKVVVTATNGLMLQVRGGAPDAHRIESPICEHHSFLKRGLWRRSPRESRQAPR